MERILPASSLPYEVGALYNRRLEIHDRLGGQRRGGISTPASSPFVILFTGEAGRQHGYHDFWDDENVLHYFGEGQKGDMRDRGGNRAIREHVAAGKRLLLFQMMGRGRPYRFLGEFRFIHSYEKPHVPDTVGKLRTALIFKLQPVESEFEPFQQAIAFNAQRDAVFDLAATSASQVVEVRLKQSLFKRRLLTVERQCRLTGIGDLRFLRASHIKPWARCATGLERTDGQNGLLLTPHADLLFDRGWITFDDTGRLVRSTILPKEVVSRIGLNLAQGRDCGKFNQIQRDYLKFHRDAVFEKAISRTNDPILELLATS